MAAISHPGEYAVPEIKFGPTTSRAVFYVVIGLVAMAFAIPAAIMTADVGLFDECFAAAEICAAP
jgi:hypothetical protein